MPANASNDVERMVTAAIAAKNHSVTGWIVGMTVGMIPLIVGIILLLGASSKSPGAIATTPWPGLISLLIAAAIGFFARYSVRRANTNIASNVRQIVSEGQHHRGKIAQARRISMTQSRVIVQGQGFDSFEQVMSTGLSDAMLLNMEVDVYTHPMHGEPLLMIDG
jgi:hypothetical protein